MCFDSINSYLYENCHLADINICSQPASLFQRNDYNFYVTVFFSIAHTTHLSAFIVSEHTYEKRIFQNYEPIHSGSGNQ